MAKHIAIVEDEIAIAENYRDALERQGYKVSMFHDRPSAEEAFQLRLPDLAIIDVGLGEEIEGGFELCRNLRAMAPTLPIIFLSARDSDFDIVSGLRLGADDYLTKDISQPHMFARIIALLRRVELMATSSDKSDSVVNRGDLNIDLERLSVTWKSERIDLTITELWIVHSLAKHPGHVKNRQQLMDAANVVLDDNTITSHIKRIRKKFQHIDSDFSSIQTAYGMGYRWEEKS
ncbi:proteobacterial dedicated sortase system response regulator [Sessilibacter corallicola]|uniref:Proteobacterial dedicated sortase system response regulator n=1 Tax=Sessilibacter corallicola TaxID=2904075 RepID=A0ABQ0A9G1_9GAMM|nr:proteobacterial dedicated sortase system response regulator [Sessilibacter corallicola]MCE2030315.1 proteobacterial dedicated sortase system response regulator [Sessilibacter corallicola]